MLGKTYKIVEIKGEVKCTHLALDKKSYVRIKLDLLKKPDVKGHEEFENGLVVWY